MKEGSLFSGYNGLGMAVSEVFGSEPAWFSEYEPPTKKIPKPAQGAAKVLAHRYPDVPNLGDITAIGWDNVERVDVLSGGFPCTDLSLAGLQAGLKPGTRSGLWSYFALAISKLRPQYVVIENVRGLLSAEAHSDVEPCPWCLGEGSGEPDLRALGAVLGDLADLGYDARWCGLRAADIGAPHGRFRVFILARDTSCGGWDVPRTTSRRGEPQGPARGSGLTTSDTSDNGCQWGTQRNLGTEGGVAASLGYDTDGRGYAPADPDRNAVREQPVTQSGSGSATLVGLAGAAAADAHRDKWTREHEQQPWGTLASGSGSVTAWGGYGPAVSRWEWILGRPAPPPTETSGKGAQRLSPRFVEWMMGLPDGHVTDAPGVNRNAQLKALGNGVVPQQAIAALRYLLEAA